MIKRFLPVLFLITLLILSACNENDKEDNLTYSGTYAIKTETGEITVSIQTSDSITSIDITPRGSSKSIKISGKYVSNTKSISVNNDTYEFTGKIDENGILSGNVTKDDVKGSFSTINEGNSGIKNYFGSYRGDDYGYWNITICDDIATGTFVTIDEDPGILTGKFNGSSGDGSYILLSSIEDLGTWEAIISGTGISGTWGDSTDGSSGTFTGYEFPGPSGGTVSFRVENAPHTTTDYSGCKVYFTISREGADNLDYDPVLDVYGQNIFAIGIDGNGMGVAFDMTGDEEQKFIGGLRYQAWVLIDYNNDYNPANPANFGSGDAIGMTVMEADMNGNTVITMDFSEFMVIE